MQLTVAQIAQFTGAVTVVEPRDPGLILNQLTWDSRTVQPGALFFALPGEHHDGNTFVNEALEGGAGAVIASRPSAVAHARDTAARTGAALLEVNDCEGNGIRALAALARGYRTHQLAATTVVGVTGSSGKTTTKDLITAVLRAGLDVTATTGNRNNEYGVPATILDANPATQALVVEMAMRGIGQIEELCAIAQPTIGVITNVGVSHMELLGSPENIARAKAELIEALPSHRGVALLNGDDPWSPFICEQAQTAQRGIRVLLYGQGPHNDIRATNVTYTSDGRPTFDLWLPEWAEGQGAGSLLAILSEKAARDHSGAQSARSEAEIVAQSESSQPSGREGEPATSPPPAPLRVQLTLQGEHNVMNALAAAATGVELGIPAAAIAAALQQATPAAMRQEMVTTATGVLVVNDAYNANPDSMRAALALLTRLSPAYPHIAVLGDMAELGAQEHSHHHAIGAFAAASGIEALITVGERARAIAQGAREEGMPADKVVACPDVATALDALAPHLARKPIVLVKASRCMGLERLVEGIGALC